MKTLTTFFSILLVFSISNSLTYSQINVISNGNVGINNSSPSHSLDIFGDFDIKAVPNHPTWGISIDNTGYMSGLALYPHTGPSSLGTSSYHWYQGYITNLYTGSDERFKTNVIDIDSALYRLLNVRTVQYDLSNYYFNVTHLDGSLAEMPEAKNKYGFLAQQLLTLFPEVVKYDKENDLYSVNYLEMIPVVISAIKDQQVQIETLKELVTSQEEELNKLKYYVGYSENLSKKSTSTEIPELNTQNVPVLYQNIPNPYNKETTIKLYLPDNIKEASLYVFDINGNKLLVRHISERKYVNIKILSSELKAGMYIYSLIADDNIIDTKRMVLTN